MSWRIFWKDGKISYWPASIWTTAELLKMAKISKFELVKDSKIKKVA